MHIHLDPLGGISGDMFVGALLDRWPEYGEQLPKQLELARFADLVDLRREAHSDGVLTGTLFRVVRREEGDAHDHRHYSSIRHHLIDADLPKGVLQLALKIFHALAEAEAEVHGQPIDEVQFHEVGSWDSIADILSAAFLIDAVGEATWSTGPLPLGRGTIETAHGTLPVPAPAVSKLLQGFPVRDDGLDGERVTPTGAAILKTLAPHFEMPPHTMELTGGGYGFGTRQFPGVSNVLRILTFDESSAADAVTERRWQHEQVAVIEFEVDDQTPEELGRAIDLLRARKGVIDVVQTAVTGKKGRQSFNIRILARPNRQEEVITACFEQTTTLGLRVQRVDRFVLPREEISVRKAGDEFRVKLATRPSGEVTAKADLDDLGRGERSQLQRARLRRKVEKKATKNQHE